MQLALLGLEARLLVRQAQRVQARRLQAQRVQRVRKVCKARLLFSRVRWPLSALFLPRATPSTTLTSSPLTAISTSGMARTGITSARSLGHQARLVRRVQVALLLARQAQLVRRAYPVGVRLVRPAYLVRRGPGVLVRQVLRDRAAPLAQVAKALLALPALKAQARLLQVRPALQVQAAAVLRVLLAPLVRRVRRAYPVAARPVQLVHKVRKALPLARQVRLVRRLQVLRVHLVRPVQLVRKAQVLRDRPVRLDRWRPFSRRFNPPSP